MNSYQYCVVDVFSTERYKGNPLSVVFTIGGLDVNIYEKIAREFGYPETSFVYYSPADKALKIRSFTPAGFEVNGAGHNLLGAVAAAIFNNINIFHEQHGEQFVIMKDEIIFLSVDYKSGKLPYVGMRQKAAVMGALVDPGLVAAAIALNTGDISSGVLVPVVVTTEVAHLMVPLKNVDVLNAAVPNKLLLHDLAKEYEFEGIYCFTTLNQYPQRFVQARFFNPGMGIEEDPATGSAAGPLAGLLFQKKYVSLDVSYEILQGEKMNHPSLIKFEVKNDGIWISGPAALVMEGTIYE